MRRKLTILIPLVAFIISSFTVAHKRDVNVILHYVTDSLIPRMVGFQDDVSGQWTFKWIKGQAPIDPGTNIPPVALAGDNKEFPVGTADATLDGSSSYDPDGSIVTYSWSQIGGTGEATIVDASSSVTQATGLLGGNNYKFRLTVTDNNGATAHVDVEYVVYDVEADQYYVTDSAAINFTPVVQSVDGWTDVVGDPSKNVLTKNVTTPSGETWTISTVNTSYWSPNENDSAAVMDGNWYIANDCPYPFIWDKDVIRSGFVNVGSEFDNNYNLKISGLNPEHKYRVEVLASIEQGYRADNLDDPDVFGCRSLITAYTGEFKNITANSNTVNRAIFDTIEPDNNGIIQLAVTGQGSSNRTAGSVGSINAMKIYDLSKVSTNSLGSVVSLFKPYYDTVLYLSDGIKTRPVVVYKPYNYDPSKSYPILVNMTGQGAAVDGSKWDANMIVQQGMGLVAEQEKGKIYGIDANGDTASFVIVIPQFSLDEWSIPPAQLNTLLTNFRNKNLYNTNSTLYLAGISSGAQQATAYAFHYPTKVKALFIIDPAQYFNSDQLSDIRNNAATYAANGGTVLASDHGDVWGQNADTVVKYMRLADPNSAYLHTMNVGHIGFVTEYKMDNIDPVYDQNVYDYFANPTHGNRKYALYYLTPEGGSSGGWNTFKDDGSQSFPRPFNTLMWSIDTIQGTGWKASTVDPSKWDYYADLSHSPQSYPQSYELKKYYLHSLMWSRGYRTKGSYDTKGPNLEISNLVPGGEYSVIFISALTTASEGYGTVYTINGTDSVSFNNYQDFTTHTFPKLTGFADENGVLKLGVYPDNKNGASYGAINAFIVVQDDE